MKNLIIKVENNVGQITLNRPNALNALTYEMILQIEETLDNWLSENIDLVIIDAVGEKVFHSVCIRQAKIVDHMRIFSPVHFDINR